MTWTRETTLEAGRRVCLALGHWPTIIEWKQLVKVAAGAGDPLPTIWFLNKLFGGILPFGRAVGAIPEESEAKPAAVGLAEYVPQVVTERRVPLPTPLGSCTYIFSDGGRATAIIIDLIPPEPEWPFDRVTVIPWGLDSHTRELTRRFSHAEYLRHRTKTLAYLTKIARQKTAADARQAWTLQSTPEEIRERLRARGQLAPLRRAILAQKQAQYAREGRVHAD